MNILYHLTSPQPPMDQTDAVFQEVSMLKNHFHGQLINHFPGSKPSRIFPKALYGIHTRRLLKNMGATTDIHHIYYVNMYAFPFMKHLKKPVIYSIIASLEGQRKPRGLQTLDGPLHIVISNERDRQILHSWDIHDFSLIRPAIDTTAFTYKEPADRKTFVLLMASAPWVKKQFDIKGIDALLQAVSQKPDLRLILLWRGLLLNELQTRIDKYGVRDRVEVINERVDVNQVLARAHAAVVLAKSAKVVKAYPHSLLECLAAGKPVLTSQAIPMADYINDRNCGVTIDPVSVQPLITGIEQLQSQYETYRKNAETAGRQDISQEQLLRAYEDLYSKIQSRG